MFVATLVLPHSLVALKCLIHFQGNETLKANTTDKNKCSSKAFEKQVNNNNILPDWLNGHDIALGF